MKEFAQSTTQDLEKFVYAFPILTEKVEEWLQFVKEINTTRKKDFSEMHARIGVFKENWYLQKKHEDFQVIVYTEAHDEQFLRRFKEDQSEFSNWFREKVSELQSIDLDSETTMPEMVLNWSSQE